MRAASVGLRVSASGGGNPDAFRHIILQVGQSNTEEECFNVAREPGKVNKDFIYRGDCII